MICLLAVNAANVKVRARFNLGGLKAKEAVVSWEGRTVAISHSMFEDDFGPFGVHVYVMKDER